MTTVDLVQTLVLIVGIGIEILISRRRMRRVRALEQRMANLEQLAVVPSTRGAVNVVFPINHELGLPDDFTQEPAEWTDPLNPHGDDTLRPGDPVFDALARGNATMGNFGSQGWQFEERKRP